MPLTLSTNVLSPAFNKNMFCSIMFYFAILLALLCLDHLKISMASYV